MRAWQKLAVGEGEKGAARSGLAPGYAIVGAARAAGDMGGFTASIISGRDRGWPRTG